MRRPCRPMVQLRGVVGVKAVRRVTDVEREGRSGEVMGGKRVSSKALGGGWVRGGVWGGFFIGGGAYAVRA